MSFFNDLKTRILNTGYLPNWLKEGIVQVKPTVFQPRIEPAPEGTPKWCPFTRAIIAEVLETGARSTGRTSKNRTVYIKRDEGNVMRVVGSSIETSYCMGDRCQMWTGTDCGMKNPLLHVQAAVEEAKRIHDEMIGTETTNGV